MKKLYSLLSIILLGGSVHAAIINVSVTSNVFTPSSVTINVGDTVRWTCTQGTHNVNGTQQTFPSNPESFGNSLASNWTYDFQFTIAGTYDYQCDPHVNFGMIGEVIVQNTTGFSDLAKETLSMNLYPNPAVTDVSIQATGINSGVLDIISPDGKIVITERITEGTHDIGVADLPRGVYFARLREDQRVITKRFLLQ